MTQPAGWIPVIRKTELTTLWTLFILIGWLQMQHEHLGYLTSQGADVVAPALLFVLTRDGKSLLRFIGLRKDRPTVIALGVFGLSLGWEICQKLHWIPGVFDPLDIAAYAAGVLAPYLLDRSLTRLEISR
ncbi:MAG TPA: hypothetical protein VHW24_07255 [Bryobacteraceae bacterium]|jgi:hypothetical protein|nr:hypothetical protein [Bryobacteraceae bacterium]